MRFSPLKDDEITTFHYKGHTRTVIKRAPFRGIYLAKFLRTRDEYRAPPQYINYRSTPIWIRRRRTRIPKPHNSSFSIMKNRATRTHPKRTKKFWRW